MTRDLIVLISCLVMLAIYTAYLTGYDQGMDEGHKACPRRRG